MKRMFIGLVLVSMLVVSVLAEAAVAFPGPPRPGNPVIVAPHHAPPPDGPNVSPPDGPNAPPRMQRGMQPGRLDPKPPMAKEPGAEFAIDGGYIAGTLGYGASLAANRLFDMPYLAVRLGYLHATDTKDVSGATRENEIALLDFIIRLNPARTPGLRSYIGLGANYIFNTTGQTQGAVGGQAFYGIEGNLGGGELFLEIGYGILRPRVSEDRSDMNLLLGYKTGF